MEAVPGQHQQIVPHPIQDKDLSTSLKPCLLKGPQQTTGQILIPTIVQDTIPGMFPVIEIIIQETGLVLATEILMPAIKRISTTAEIISISITAEM
jgi:hypothetical protein